jgi:hypothetical protein
VGHILGFCCYDNSPEFCSGQAHDHLQEGSQGNRQFHELTQISTAVISWTSCCAWSALLWGSWLQSSAYLTGTVFYSCQEPALVTEWLLVAVFTPSKGLYDASWSSLESDMQLQAGPQLRMFTTLQFQTCPFVPLVPLYIVRPYMATFLQKCLYASNNWGHCPRFCPSLTFHLNHGMRHDTQEELKTVSFSTLGYSGSLHVKLLSSLNLIITHTSLNNLGEDLSKKKLSNHTAANVAPGWSLNWSLFIKETAQNKKIKRTGSIPFGSNTVNRSEENVGKVKYFT